jgi:LAGLIDADG endonuclease
MAFGESVKYRVIISQNIRSLAVMNEIQSFLGEGKVNVDNKSMVTFKIASLAGVNALITKFTEAKLYGAKALDYADFCKGIEVINSKAHLTPEGFLVIKSLIAGMNSTRTDFGSEFNH